MAPQRAVCALFIAIIIICAVSRNNVKAYQTIEANTVDELQAATWNARARDTLSEHLDAWHGVSTARSAVLVVGGGMSLHTLRASRAYMGQALMKETPLDFENFPITGMVKTFCVDSQMGDAACTATSYLRGVKGRAGVVGAPASGAASRCGIPDDVEGEKFGTIVEWALEAGKSIGIVTTSSVTQASVAGSYGHSSLSSWQSDADIEQADIDQTDCPDLAYQLIHKHPGNKFKVILGGGRENFQPTTTNVQGRRKDKKNLVTEWTNDKVNKKITSQFVSTIQELSRVANTTETLLGLFSPGAMEYHISANASQPTIEEMTEAAIKVLSNNEKGFFLFVFGGRINDAHNENKARIAVDETIELNKAVRKVSEMTNPSETLIVVTADHAHTMTLSGYASRWNDIFGEALPPTDDNDTDGFPYLSINYGNGPGFRKRNQQGLRTHVVREQKYLNHDPSFQYPSVFPLASGTSGAEDVALFARGPSQHLFTGVFEQYLIPHLMAYSMCIGPGITACHNTTSDMPSLLLPSTEGNSRKKVKKSSSAVATLSPVCFVIIIFNLVF